MSILLLIQLLLLLLLLKRPVYFPCRFIKLIESLLETFVIFMKQTFFCKSYQIFWHLLNFLVHIPYKHLNYVKIDKWKGIFCVCSILISFKLNAAASPGMSILFVLNSPTGRPIEIFHVFAIYLIFTLTAGTVAELRSRCRNM